MDRHKILFTISFILMTVGMLVICGWIFNIGVLKSINPGWTPMKFMTAICFIMCGLEIFSINKMCHGEFEISSLVLSVASLVMLIITSIFFISTFFKIPVSLEQLFVGEIIPNKNVLALVPCMVSMLNFLLFSAVGIAILYGLKFYKQIFLIIGVFTGLTGLFSLSGHILRIPILYFDIPGVSTAMSVISGPLFIRTGICFYLFYSCPSGVCNLKQKGK